MPWSDMPHEAREDGVKTIMTCRILPPTHRRVHSVVRVEIAQPGVGLWWGEWEALKGRLGASQLDEMQATVAVRLAAALLVTFGQQLEIDLPSPAGPAQPLVR